MNYLSIYNKIVENAKTRKLSDYVEKHHIIPKSLGGSDTKVNIVELTAKEHFVCHLLLTKIYSIGTNEWHKMIKAFMMMCCHNDSHNRYTGRIHENYRKRFSQVQSESQSGKNNSNFGTKWIYNLELKQSKKIGKNQEVPLGWKIGRVINFNNVKHCCVCNKEFISKNRKSCSDQCNKLLKYRRNPFYNREEEFYDLYDKLGSLNQACKEMGFPGAVSYYYKTSKKLLDNR